MAEIVYLAQPFIEIPGNSTHKLFTMDYAYMAQPFVRGEQAQQQTIITGNIKRILKVDWPYVKTVITVEG